MPRLPKVLLLHTGGTLGMDSAASFEVDDGFVHLKPRTGGVYKGGLQPGSMLDDLLGQVPELKTFAELDLQVVFNKDSCRVGPEDWGHLARLLDRYRTEYDAFIIVHGTDTMAYTACALSLMLAGFRKPIIVTGSQVGCTPSTPRAGPPASTCLGSAAPRGRTGCRADRLPAPAVDAADRRPAEPGRLNYLRDGGLHALAAAGGTGEPAGGRDLLRGEAAAGEPRAQVTQLELPGVRLPDLRTAGAARSGSGVEPETAAPAGRHRVPAAVQREFPARSPPCERGEAPRRKRGEADARPRPAPRR